MSGALVSCIIPTYNGARYLAEALDSVFGQTHREIEVIVVDDGSTDDTRAIVERDPRPIRLISQANAGPIAARNNGIEHANGDLVSFLDHDDLWVPEKLAWQVSAFANRPGLGACVGYVQEFETDGAGVAHNRGEPVVGYLTGTMMLSRAALCLVGPLNPELGHADSADWFLRARHAGVDEVLCPQVLLLRRLHGSNRSQLLNDGVRREFLSVLKANLDRNRTSRR